MPNVEVDLTKVDLQYPDTSAGITNGLVADTEMGKAVIKRPEAQQHVNHSGDDIKLVGSTKAVGFWGTDFTGLFSLDTDKDLRISYKTDATGYTTLALTNFYAPSATHVPCYTANDTSLYIRNTMFDPLTLTASYSDYIVSLKTKVLIEITDADHPIKASRGACYGVVWLDGYWFVGDGASAYSPTVTGRIYNSNLGSYTLWDALDYIEHDSEGDILIAIAKHKNHLVAFGGNSITFYYNAGHPSGSPLSPRLDIRHNVGIAVYDTTGVVGKTPCKPLVEFGDYVFFIGSFQGKNFTPTVKFSPDIMVLDNFQPVSITTPAVRRLLIDMVPTHINMLHFAGQNYVSVMGVNKTYSLVYDINNKLWYMWTIRPEHAAGEYLLLSGASNGEIHKVANKHDTTLQDNIGGSTSSYSLTIITPIIDDVQTKFKEGYGKRKICNSLRLPSYKYDGSSAISYSISYSDDNYKSFSTARTLTPTLYPKLSRLGQFRDRAFKIVETSTNDSVMLVKLVLDVDILDE